ncbi:hypothetical protein B0H10DRAFT_1949223 [Mycena sp. CBHHK59/15]|nr:hypothetical protein B0H10DRAFT_1949223 [Mycena sp. CBHHK59/15]
MSSHLPQEIIVNLHGDIPALKLFSLAARTFIHSTHTNIFCTVLLGPPPGTLQTGCNQCKNFYDLLCSAPHIAGLVNELHITLVCSDIINNSGNVSDDSEPHISWILGNEPLSLILPLLNLQAISIIDNSPPYFAHRLSGSHFCMNWTTLGDDRIDPSVDHEPWPQSLPWLPKLHSLTALELVGSPSDPISHVRSATVASWEKEVTPFLEAVLCGNSIEHIHLWSLPLLLVDTYNSALNKVEAPLWRQMVGILETHLVSGMLDSLESVEVRGYHSANDKEVLAAWETAMRHAFSAMSQQGCSMGLSLNGMMLIGINRQD